MKPVYSMKGVGGLLEVYEDRVNITPKGVLGFLNKGLKGTKSIPFFSITGVQFKKSGMTSGYIQFTMPGGNESRGGVLAATRDENTFMFARQNELAIEIKDYIENRIQELHRPQASSPAFSITDELQKLVDMKTNGILSDDEFEAAKRRIIG